MHFLLPSYWKCELPAFLWYWLPLVVFCIPPICHRINKELYETWILSEFGIIENLTVLFLVLAMLVGLLALQQPFPNQLRRLKYWITLLLIGCFYFCGEELSWGQHFFGWETPEGWARVNGQQETNLHNLKGFGSSLLSVFPRVIVSLTLGASAIALPLYLRSKHQGRVAAANFLQSIYVYWIIPTVVVVPTALLVTFPRIPRKIVKELTGSAPEWLNVLGQGETKECLVAYFLLLYLSSMYVRQTSELARARSPVLQTRELFQMKQPSRYSS